MSVKAPVHETKLLIAEQSVPGDPAEFDEEEAGRRGLPDFIIHDGASWCRLIESKVQAALTQDQLARHERTLRCLGAQLAISVHNCPVLADTRFPMSIFKRTQRKYVKKAYRVRNWREYEAGLRNRGSLTVWIFAHRRQACELGRAPAKEEETGPSTQVLEPRHRDGCHPGHGVSSVI